MAAGSDMPERRLPAEQMASPSYRLAALDQDFILSESMRGVRFMLEYQKADEALRKAKIASTIVVFGSARVREDSPGDHGRWYAEARRFARIASERGGAIDGEGVHTNVIATGGGPASWRRPIAARMKRARLHRLQHHLAA